MKPVSTLTVILVGWFFFSWSHRPEQNHMAAYESLKAGFLEPPMQARPKVYWWWLNGNVDTVKLLEELSAMKAAGVGGVDIFDIGARAPNNPDKMIPAGPPFMGPQSLAAITMVIKKATEYKMEVSLNLASSWNAGGSWIKPAHAGKSLYYSKINVEGPGQKKMTIPFPEIPPVNEKGKPRVIEYDASHKPVYSKEVVVLAIPAGQAGAYLDTSRIINISRNFDVANNQLNWEVPAGRWEIHRYVCSNSGEQLKYYSDNSAGPIIDHFDSSATRAHFMYFIDRLLPVLGDFRKTALKNFYLASFEATGSVWTESLPVEFRKINGYDIFKLMPALMNPAIFDSLTYQKFKHDFDLVISELMIRNHYGKGKEIANAYGLQLISEAGGPGPPLHNVPVEAIKALGALDIPRGEFWNQHAVYDQDSIDLLMLVKEISAAAHMYGRKYVEEESFTSFQHWTEGPFELKPLGDRAFCEGMNRVVIHGFSHNPSSYGYPGIVYHAGTHFNNKSLWWSKAKPFTDYLSRVSWVLQETRFVADVLFYYGDNVPNFAAPKNTRFSVGAGYDYDIINTDVLLRDLRVKDGRLVLPGGASFRVLSLGNMERANLDVMEKLKKLALEGAIITGARPSGANSLLHQPGADARVQRIADELWMKDSSSPANIWRVKGKVLPDVPAREVLEALQVAPDFAYQNDTDGVLDFIHQSKDALDVYYIRNTTDQWVSRVCAFRQANKVPEIWDPVTGLVLPVNVYHTLQEQTRIPISLAPFQSYLVVFKNETSGVHFTEILGQETKLPLISYTSEGVAFLETGQYQLVSAKGRQQVRHSAKPMVLEGPWKLAFKKGWGAPDTVSFPTLISWTSSSIPGIKYYSGPVTYTKSFRFDGDLDPANGRLYLDLGDLSRAAEVWLNGQWLGIAWAKPFSFDITGKLKPGSNNLKIEVVNNWSNRLAGDAITGTRFTSTNLGKSSQGVAWADAPLIPSGLMGPVTISSRKAVR